MIKKEEKVIVALAAFVVGLLFLSLAGEFGTKAYSFSLVFVAMAASVLAIAVVAILFVEGGILFQILTGMVGALLFWLGLSRRHLKH